MRMRALLALTPLMCLALAGCTGIVEIAKEAEDGSTSDPMVDARPSEDSSVDAIGHAKDAGPAIDSSQGQPSGTDIPPSCAPGGPGITNCGPGGSGSESCCTSLEVTGGSYYRTYSEQEADGGGFADDGGFEDGGGFADPATVSEFRLDKYLVTVGRFRQFVAAWNGGFDPASGSGKHTHLNAGQGLANSGEPGTYETGWNASWDTGIDPTDANLAICASESTWTTSDSGGHENLPIDCVTWYEAYAFCIWDQGFLPSEAEWEAAAAGESEQREYPWGSADPGETNEYAIYEDDYGYDATFIAPVGFASLGAGRYGQLDLAGEVSEWTLDWRAAYVDPCVDCAYLKTASARMVRGGYYGTDAEGLLSAGFRIGGIPALRSGAGIRCARTP